MAWVCWLMPGPTFAADSTLRLERAVGLFRHGIRSPLKDEAPTIQGLPVWPTWNTPAGELTDQGYRGAQLLADYLRREWQQRGLLSAPACDALPGLRPAIRIYANSLPRTIKSGEAMLEQLAPGCHWSLEHRPLGSLDPLFNSIATGAVQFDAAAAREALDRTAPTAAALVRRHHRTFAALARVLGCEQLTPPCEVAQVFDVPPLTIDNNGVRAGGAIEAGAGGAQVLMLHYLQGMSMQQPGMGRVDEPLLERLSVLHTLPFEVQSRPPYLARRIAAPLLNEVVAALQSPQAPQITLFVGHDNHLSAFASVFGLNFKVPGYARNDPAVGGGLIFELLRSTHTGEQYVRARYIAQMPRQLRLASKLTDDDRPYEVTLKMTHCTRGAALDCKLDVFVRLTQTVMDEAQLKLN